MTKNSVLRRAAWLLAPCLGLSACGGDGFDTLDSSEEPILGQNEQALVLGTRAIGWAWFNGSVGNAPALYQFHERIHELDEYPFSSGPGSGPTSVTRSSIGNYLVIFPHLAVEGGTAHVSAYAGRHACKIASWFPRGDDQVVNVVCHDSAGARTDGAFSVLFYRDDGRVRSDVTGSAYLWANNPTAASYTPSTPYQFNSRHAVNTVRRLGTGSYEATLPHMERSGVERNKGGTAQVTAYGTGSERCQVVNWQQPGNDIVVRVNCFGVAGTPVDSRFSLTWTRGPGDFATFKAEDTQERFYVWADTPGAPNAFYQSDSYGQGGATSSFISPNRYVVRLPHVKPAGSSNAIVTAYGSTEAYCAINSWTPDAVGTAVDVSCFDRNGPRATRFDLLYSTDTTILF